jgi:hypothetical protein
MVTYTFTTAQTVGELGAQKTITHVRLASVYYSNTPDAAPTGSEELEVRLKDPDSGYLFQTNYLDATVATFWAAATTLASTGTLGDTVAAAIFAKLVADSKLPAGTLTVAADSISSSSSTSSPSSSSTTATASTSSASSTSSSAS